MYMCMYVPTHSPTYMPYMTCMCSCRAHLRISLYMPIYPHVCKFVYMHVHAFDMCILYVMRLMLLDALGRSDRLPH